MREDTQEIADNLEVLADLATENEYERSIQLMAKISKLLTEWVERHLKP